jgi:hypothetical protein
LYDISNVKIIPDDFSSKIAGFIGLKSDGQGNINDLILAVIGLALFLTVVSGLYFIFKSKPWFKNLIEKIFKMIFFGFILTSLLKSYMRIAYNSIYTSSQIIKRSNSNIT